MRPLPRADVLSPLYRNCLFRSDERVDAHDRVSRELADHMLRWGKGAPDVAMFKGQVSRLGIYLLHYGAEVEVTPRPFDDFSLVHTSLAGRADIEVDGHSLMVSEGRSAVLAPRRSVRLRWHPGTQQLILKVPHRLVRELAGFDLEQGLELAPGFLIARGHDSQWNLVMQSLLNTLALPPESAVNGKWLDHFERSAAMFLLSHRAPAVERGDAPRRSAFREEARTLSRSSRQMNAILECMQARIDTPLSLDDLAAAAGVSVRTINELCRRHRGVTPMELLRHMRLDAVRAQLQGQPDLSITEAALTFGFGHLGRFSAYYFERFGELPRQTQSGPRE